MCAKPTLKTIGVLLQKLPSQPGTTTAHAFEDKGVPPLLSAKKEEGKGGKVALGIARRRVKWYEFRDGGLVVSLPL